MSPDDKYDGKRPFHPEKPFQAMEKESSIKLLPQKKMYVNIYWHPVFDTCLQIFQLEL